MAHKSPARRHQQLEFNEGLHGKLTAVSYTPKAGLSFTKWQEAGVTLGRLARSMNFWTGDWLLWGEEHMGERYAQAIQATGRDEKTLLTYVRVCKAVEVERRREELSFSHHEAVSMLDAEAQSYWLQKAIDGDTLPSGEHEVWSSRRLKAEVAKLGQEEEDPDPEIEVVDLALVPTVYLVPDYKKVCDAFKAGVHEIPGLKITPPAAVQAEMGT